ncbi:MAG: hypothetical protein WD069_01210 [Planctomycetales bacterium]
MSASFAGSKHLDERRRRRLAADADDPAAAPVGLSFAPPQSGGASERIPARAHFPVRKLISHTAWKHWAVGLWALVAGGLLLWAGARSADAATVTGPHFLKLFDPIAGRIVPFYQSALLAIAGQLALLIGWARSRSQEDFQGRYRVWTWWAGGCLLFAFAVLTGAHLAFGETIALFWKLPQPHAPLLAWLAPACAAGYVLFRGVRAEMIDDRPALALVRLAGLCWLIAAAERLGWLAAGAARLPQVERLAPLAADPLLLPGLLVTAPALLLTAMLLHARHVIHRCAEPPARRRTLLQRALGAVVRRQRTDEIDSSSNVAVSQKISLEENPVGTRAAAKPLIRRDQLANRDTFEAVATPSPAASRAADRAESAAPKQSLLGRVTGIFRGRAALGASETTAAEGARGAASPQPKTTSATSSPKPAAKPPSPKSPAADATDSDSSPWDDADDAADDRRASRGPGKSGRKSRVDQPPPDPQVLKGLSKRERRMVRKQWRDQQRAEHAAAED